MSSNISPKYKHPSAYGMILNTDAGLSTAADRIVDKLNQVSAEQGVFSQIEDIWMEDRTYQRFGVLRGMIQITFNQHDLHQIRVWRYGFKYEPGDPNDPNYWAYAKGLWKAGDGQITRALRRLNIRCVGDNLTTSRQCLNVAQYILRDPDKTLWAGCFSCREIAQGTPVGYNPNKKYPDADLDFISMEERKKHYARSVARARELHPDTIWEQQA